MYNKSEDRFVSKFYPCNKTVEDENRHTSPDHGFIEYFYFYRYRHVTLKLQHKILYKNRIAYKNTNYEIPEHEFKHIYNNWCDLCYFINILNDTKYNIISILFDTEGYKIYDIVKKII